MRTGCEVDGCHDPRLVLLQLPPHCRPSRHAFEFGGRPITAAARSPRLVGRFRVSVHSTRLAVSG